MAKDKSVVDRAWDFLASVKLAIIVFSLIALTSIVGTVIEQNAAPAKNIEILTSLVGGSLAPGVYKLLYAMGFMDMYHSWWFVGLLLVFATNLLICSLDRLPPVLRLVREPMKPLKPESFKSFPVKAETRAKGKPDEVKARVASELKSMGFRCEEVKEEKGVQFYAQKGRFGRLGVYITHLSIIVILIGAIIGIFFGFKGGLNLPEGLSYAMAFKSVGYLDNEEEMEQRLLINVVQKTRGDLGKAASELGVSVENLKARMKYLGVEPLGFNITCEDFEVEFYGTSDMAKEYKSLLSVNEGGEVIERKWIEVNDPLKYKGYTFYQSSYGLYGSASDYRYIIKASSGAGNSETYTVRLGEKFQVPGADIEAFISEFSPALSFDQSGRPFTYSEMMNNPAAKLTIYDDGKENSKWVLKRYPSTWTVSGSNTIQLVDVWGAQYTGLQVRKDPGVWIVYLGCLFMSAGLYIAFFVSHRKVWVRVHTDKAGASVSVAATSHKGREVFERKIGKMISLLREGGKQ